MSNKPKHSKTNITKISAKPASAQPADNTKPTANPQPVSVQPTANTKLTQKTKPTKKSKSKVSTEKPLKSVFILARPFVALGRYLRDSWREIRQVRWPGRKLTWKMTLAVLIYCAIFIVFIVLVDTFFTFIFNLLINAK